MASLLCGIIYQKYSATSCNVTFRLKRIVMLACHQSMIVNLHDALRHVWYMSHMLRDNIDDDVNGQYL